MKNVIKKYCKNISFLSEIIKKIYSQKHICTNQENNPEIVDIYKEKKNNIIQKDIKKISVIIPNYNYEKYIIERIDSILFQTYPIYELIILDDCSTDNSVNIIKEKLLSIPESIKTSIIINKKNSGSVFAQWQKAFQVANGEYIWIAEADDSCSNVFLETVMQGFADKDVVISYCESLTMDKNNVLLMRDLREWIDIFNCGKWDKDYIKDGCQEVAETMCINNTIANVSSVVFKNNDYDEILEGAKNYKLAGDWYVYMNILKNGKIAYFHRSLNYHRMQEQGLTLSTKQEEEFNEIVRLQNFAIKNFLISDSTKEKIFQRRERERIRFGL